jgi:hypothetical protein
MSTNLGVIILYNQEVIDGPFKADHRFAIEDNIGEGIHIHYKNMRLDFTVSDFLKLSESCKVCLDKMGYKIVEENGQITVEAIH